jgi:hypothetical protein
MQRERRRTRINVAGPNILIMQNLSQEGKENDGCRIYENCCHTERTPPRNQGHRRTQSCVEPYKYCEAQVGGMCSTHICDIEVDGEKT